MFVLAESTVGAYLIPWFSAVFTYTLFIEGSWGGRFVGKYIVGMSVVKDRGGGIGIGSSLVRNFVGSVGRAFGRIGLLAGAFAIYRSDENEGIGDSAAGSVVIKDR